MLSLGPSYTLHTVCMLLRGSVLPVCPLHQQHAAYTLTVCVLLRVPVGIPSYGCIPSHVLSLSNTTTYYLLTLCMDAHMHTHEEIQYVGV